MLRSHGWTLYNVGDIPETVLNYIAEQINVNPKEYEQYAQRENTKFEHLQEIRESYSFTNYVDIDTFW